MNKYEEALERARAFIERGGEYDRQVMESIFPELKESEDERIRNALVKTFEKKLEIGFEWTEFGIPNRSVLDWLEKQKEKKMPVSEHRVGPAGEKDMEMVEQLPTEYCIYQDIRKKLIALVEKFGQEEDKEEMLDYLEKYQPIESAREVKEYNFQPGDPDEKAIKRLKEMIYYACDESSDVPPDEACALDDWLDDKCKPAVLEEQKPIISDEAIRDGVAHFGITQYQIDNWLKKHINVIEQKPAEKQDYSGLNNLERVIHRGFLSAGVENVPFAIIKETAQECLAQMKSAEWTEEDKRKLNRIYEILGYAADEKAFLSSKRIIGDKEAIELQDFLKSFCTQPKQEWSEEDKIHLTNAILAAEKAWGTGSSTVKWLKSLRPQPKQEWTEEDERNLYNIIEAIKYVFDVSEDSKCSHLITWIKSRLRPQPHWNPSKDEITAIEVSEEELTMLEIIARHFYGLGLNARKV